MIMNEEIGVSLPIAADVSGDLPRQKGQKGTWTGRVQRFWFCNVELNNATMGRRSQFLLSRTESISKSRRLGTNIFIDPQRFSILFARIAASGGESDTRSEWEDRSEDEPSHFLP
jgi:hypothetical protein